MPPGSPSGGTFSSSTSSPSHVFNNNNSTNKSSDNSKTIAVINANARSLGPKIESLADCIHEVDADIAIVSETWFQDDCVTATAIDVAGEHGLDLFTLNRQVIAANGRQYGGVAVTTRACRSTFKKVDIANPDNFEVLCLEGKIKGIGEKIVVVAVYIPPNYPRHKANSCLDYIADVISEAKRRFSSAMITVAGDWNQWPVDHVLQEHTDMTEVEHGPTRNERKIDKFLVNFGRAVSESDTLRPLDDGLGRESDHLVAFFRATVPRARLPVVKYRYRHYTDEGARRFQQWVENHNFGAVYGLAEVNGQLDCLLRELGEAMDLCFPYRTTVRRESDPPWINRHVRAIIRKRRKVYHREGRSPRWKELMKAVRKLVKKRARNYWKHQKRTLLQKDASRSFFKNAKAYSSREKPASFDVRSLFPGGRSDSEIAEDLADHFNGISSEFNGLDPADVPLTYSSPIPFITEQQLVQRLKSFKKPKSMVKHDIFPALVNDAAPFLAGPLCHIYNTMLSNSSWPLKWKEEFVTPIPKKAVPESMNDLRNISCTALFSKVFESFVLGWLTEQVGIRQNQMGGMRGAGTEHYLVQLWQLVLESLEDPRAASLLTSIDYAKAFNRLDFGCCLRALADKGASNEVLQLIASFLTSRTMSVKVGQEVSAPRIVLGGVPQGSILGVFLFNATIDSFESSSRDVLPYDVIGGNGLPQANPPQHDQSLNMPAEQPYDRPGFKAWEDWLLRVLKYVDDNLIHEKICLDGLVIDENGMKVARAIRTQNLFRQISRVARNMGMKVNSAKTLLMCISDSRTYKAGAFFEDEDGIRIDSTDHMKILGVHFSSRPDVSAQVDAVCKRVRSRIWMLRHLHHNGFNQTELLAVYRSCILPVLDYCSNVYNSSLTLSQSIVLERLQAKALKAIYGYDPSYRELVELSGLTTLRARREARELSFATKCANSARFSRWFPLVQRNRDTRSPDQYVEEFARCSRCYNSPLFSMRRKLNAEIRRGGAREVGTV